MSNKKPLNKYNKAELYQLAKDNRDIVKSLKQNLTMAMNEIDELNLKVSNLTDKLREKTNINNANQKVLKTINAQKKLEALELKNKVNNTLDEMIEDAFKEKPKKKGFWRNLFS